MQYLLFSFWLHSVWQSLDPSTSLQMVQFHSFLWPSNIPLYICTESESEWKSLSCTTLCNPMDCIVHGILQARILEWVAVPFSRGSSQCRDWTQVSRIAGRFFISWARQTVEVIAKSRVRGRKAKWKVLCRNRKVLVLLRSKLKCDTDHVGTDPDWASISSHVHG